MAISFDAFVSAAVDSHELGLDGEAQRAKMAELCGVDVKAIAAKISAVRNDKKSPIDPALEEILPVVGRKGKPRVDRAAILAKYGLKKA